MDKERPRTKPLIEVYKDSGLGKWFHNQSAGGEPGWDRYNTKGEKAGKCGDSKPGEGKPKCLSKQKAAKLRSKGGNKAIANAVKNKRKKDPKQDRPGTGNKPINVSNRIEDSYMNIKELEVGSTIIVENKLCFVEKISRVADSTYKVDYINETARRGKEFYTLSDKIEVKENDLVEEKETKKKLNKPFRTSGGPKKFSVYVKNERGNVVKVNFGDPNMEIKRDSAKRRKSFRARHNCASPGPKTKARYWSCYQWRGSSPVADDVEYTGNFIAERTDKEERNISEETKSAINSTIRLKEDLLNEENVPTNPGLWSQAKSKARAKFDVYPSAYANAWASKWYKGKGGGWKKKSKKKVNEAYLKTKRMDKDEKTYHDFVTKELEGTKAFKTINPRYKKDIHKEVSKMILIANDLLTKEKK